MAPRATSRGSAQDRNSAQDYANHRSRAEGLRHSKEIRLKVFVYGANLKGIHGAGAALEAKRKWGAVQGVIGRSGASYGIATKRTPWETLALWEIEQQVQKFLRHADICHDDEFEVTPIGCGLAGLMPQQIAPMFANAPANVHLPDVFKEVLRGKK